MAVNPSSRSATILVVDDEPANLDLMKTLLSYQGHIVRVANCGAEALQLARESQPDLLIADVLMPTMDGYELARRIRMDAGLATMPILFWTAAHLELESRALVRKTGALGVLRKPGEPEEIFRAVNDALDGRWVESPGAARAEYPGGELGWITLRLNALITAIRRISAQRNTSEIVQTSCREAREIIGAAVCLLVIAPAEQDCGDQYCWLGPDAGMSRDSCLALGRGLSAQAAARRKEAIRLGGAELEKSQWLDEQFRRMHSLLAVPIQSLSSHYGWVCLMEKLGLDQFSPEDKHIAGALAAHVALRYESAMLENTVSRLNSELVDQVARLSQANADLEQFNYAISHDLKEPLRTVYNYTDLLLRRHAQSADANLRGLVNDIHAGIERVRAMIDGLTWFYRAGRAGDAPSGGTNSVDVIEEAVGNCAAAIADSQAAVTWDRTPGVDFPRAGLLQIFQNMLSNALKYRRPDVPPSIHVSARALETQVEFSVADNGIGIAPAQRERIFELFQRLHSDEYPGLGLGLAICARLVRKRGGRIWVDESESGGAVFRFTLPRAPAAPPA